MAFKLHKGPIIAEAKVTVNHPTDGETSFTGKFKILKHDEYQNLLKVKKDDMEMIKAIMVGWSDVSNQEDKDLPFSDEALVSICEYPFVRTGIMRAYSELHLGFSTKKLAEAARYWAHGPAETKQERQDLLEEMRLFGAADNDISAFECSQEDVDDDFYVYEENWPVLCWFLDVSDQFNYTQGVCTGVNLIGIQSDAQMSGREYTPEQYSSLRFLMRMAARELNTSLEKK